MTQEEPSVAGQPPGAGQPPIEEQKEQKEKEQKEQKEQEKAPPAPEEERPDIRELWDGLTAVAAQPGNTSKRIRTERDALRGLSAPFGQATVTAGRAYGGDHFEFVVGARPDRVTSTQVAGDKYGQITQAFVTPSCFPVVAEAARSRPVLLLRGKPGSGKATLAFRVLVNAGLRSLYEFAPGTALGELGEDDFQQETGYLLADLSRGQAAELNRFEVQRLAGILEAKGSRLVVTMGAEVRLDDPGIAAEAVEVDQSVAPLQVLEAHLRWRLGTGSEGRVAEFLSHTDRIRDLVGEQGPLARLGRAADAALLLAEAKASEPAAKVLEQVTSRLALRETSEFDRWFEELGDLDTQCLALAVAVFGGETYETVVRLARELQDLIQLPESIDNPEKPRSAPIRSTAARRLALLHAARFEEQGTAQHGGVPRRVVRYLDQEMAARVLVTVWDEYDEIRVHLPEWLYRCVGEEPATVAIRAAVAVGILADRAFDTMRTSVLQRWASRRPSRNKREEVSRRHSAVAAALRTMAANPRLTEQVRGLVQEWAGNEENPFLQAAAARSTVALAALGEQGAAEMFTLLHELAGTAEFYVVDAIRAGVADLVEEADHRRGDVITLLRHWVHSYDPQRRLVGEIAFLFTAADLVAPDPGGGTEEWPLLLAMSTRDPVCRRNVGALWETVLNSADLYGEAQSILTGWAQNVDANPAARRALARLLRDAATKPRTVRILHYLIRNWFASAEHPSPENTAREVLSLLDGRTLLR